MKVFSCTKRLLLAVLFLALAGSASATPVPDLLEQSAERGARALRSLQLAVSSAGERLVSVGERGVILLSDDAGRSWRQATHVPVSAALTDVHFADANTGWAVGHSGVILHSADGGETWVLQVDGRSAAEQVLAEATEGVAQQLPGADAALRGAEFLVQDGPDKPFLAVRFRDAQNGYAVGAYGLALRTEDGGRHWQSFMLRIPNPRGVHLYRIGFDGDHVLLAGEQGALFRSMDAGSTFSELKTPYHGTFFGAMTLAEGGLLAYGLRGNVWRSDEAGEQWVQIDIAQPVTLHAGGRLTDGSLVLINESGSLLRSTDEGRSFHTLPARLSNGPTGFVATADGGLVASGVQGVTRVDLQFGQAEAQP